MSPLLGKACKHRKTGKVYVGLFYCKAKINGSWVDAVAYCDTDTNEPYMRLKDDFDSSFFLLNPLTDNFPCS